MEFEHGGNVHRFIREQEGQLEALLDFSANINPLGISAKGREALRGAETWLGHYPDPEYMTLRESLSSYYQAAVAHISVFNGGAEGIHELFRYIKPRKAMLTAPSFVEYEKALKAHETVIEWFYLKPDQQFQIDQHKLLVTLELERPDLLVLCTPNNPTGQVISSDYLEDLAKMLQRWHGRLVIDEAFIDFLPQGFDSACKWLPLYDNVYVLKSFTKFFGVPGLRLGAVISADKEFHAHVQSYSVPWRINVMAEHYAVGALQDKDYINETKTYMHQARPLLMEKLALLPGFKIFDSLADYLLIYVPPEIADSLEKGLRDRQILIRNCENYKGLGRGYFRVAVKSEAANERLVAAINEVLLCV